MKKLFLTAAVAVSSLTFAQQFGAKAGMNVSTISDEGFDDTKSKVGYYAGVFIFVSTAVEVLEMSDKLRPAFTPNC